MSSITDIEAAIENLPASQLEELSKWFEEYRLRRTTPAQVESWLKQAKGAATPSITTTSIMAVTRGEA